jgi:hypothetical protein
MKNWLTPLLLVAALFTLGACTSTSEIISTGLKIELTRVERAADGTVHVSWRVRNPNIVPYLVDRSIHRVKLDGLVLGTITDTARLGVPPQSPADRTSTITPNGAMSAEQFAKLVAKGSASYQVDTTIYLLIYDDEVTKASLSATGTVPVSAK